MILDLNMPDNIIFIYFFIWRFDYYTEWLFSVILLELLINGKVIRMG